MHIFHQIVVMVIAGLVAGYAAHLYKFTDFQHWTIFCLLVIAYAVLDRKEPS